MLKLLVGHSISLFREHKVSIDSCYLTSELISILNKVNKVNLVMIINSNLHNLKIKNKEPQTFLQVEIFLND